MKFSGRPWGMEFCTRYILKFVFSCTYLRSAILRGLRCITMCSLIPQWVCKVKCVRTKENLVFTSKRHSTFLHFWTWIIYTIFRFQIYRRKHRLILKCTRVMTFILMQKWVNRGWLVHSSIFSFLYPYHISHPFIHHSFSVTVETVPLHTNDHLSGAVYHACVHHSHPAVDSLASFGRIH